MKWKQMTIGKRISVGFGVVLVLLFGVGLLSYFGVGKIVHDAGQVIDGNKTDSILAQKEVDHLNWVGKVNALLTDHDVRELDVQTDHTKCAFGKWLYGEGRRKAERLIPAIVPLLKEIEIPHEQLHQSAVKIGEAHSQPHPGLLLTLEERLIDHIKWVEKVGRELAGEAGGLFAYQARLKNVVQQAISQLPNQETSVSGFEMIEKQSAYSVLKKLRYGDDGKGYVFVLDQSHKMIMHPFKPALEGQNVKDMKDPDGTPLFVEMVDVVVRNGKGFVFYKWPKPGETEPHPKITYVELYEPWGWILGSGVYLDFKNKALLSRAEAFKNGVPFTVGVQTDPAKCAFGRFLADEKTHRLAAEFPELKQMLAKIIAPHERLHQTAIAIENNVNQFNMSESIRIFQNETQNALRDVQALFKEVIQAEQSLENRFQAANRIYAAETVPHLASIQDLLGEIRETVRNNIMTDDVMLNSAQFTQRNVSIAGITAIVIGILLAFFIARGIVKVLGKVSGQMDEGAAQVFSASYDISSSSQSLAEASSEQAASLEETSSSLEEMASMTNQNADNASQANQLMRETDQVVKQATTEMESLNQSMNEISKASEETQKIVKTIDEIAFQTNLLALNAAVEAARAGEAGAGFAVVADEVRNLAIRAADSAKNTSVLIDDTAKRVNDGTTFVSRSTKAFGDISISVSKVGELVSEIAAASKEQAQGVDQVNMAVAEMDKVVQQNAASAEESASASEEMSAQAEQIKSLAGEMVHLVGGGVSNGKRRRKKNAPPTLAYEKKHAVEETADTAKPQTVSADDMIPFDDDDFKDF